MTHAWPVAKGVVVCLVAATVTAGGCKPWTSRPIHERALRAAFGVDHHRAVIGLLETECPLAL
ncbi:MAG: hypothetical protein Q7V01_14465, partial [Vicinamibacterales bacterium]|nr:hypothetical protein [Vicinamibacterales bacterium]